MQVNLKECKAARLDSKKVAALARRLSECGQEAQRMGLCVFGSGQGRLQQLRGEYPLIVAFIDGAFDGGPVSRPATVPMSLCAPNED